MMANVGASDIYQKSFETADLKHNLNQKLLRAIGQHESGLNSLVIGFVVKDGSIARLVEDDLMDSPIKFKKRPYKSWVHFALTFKDASQAKQAIPWLEKATKGSTGYDIGIMQINSRNAHANSWDIAKLIDDPSYNIDKGAQILSDCRDQFHWHPAKTVECYNKGRNTAIFDYKYYYAVFSKFNGKPMIVQKIKKSDANISIKQAKQKQENTLPQYYSGSRTLF